MREGEKSWSMYVILCAYKRAITYYAGHVDITAFCHKIKDFYFIKYTIFRSQQTKNYISYTLIPKMHFFSKYN